MAREPAFLEEFQEELRTKRYRPQAGQSRVHPQGRTAAIRPLGIPTVKDRMVQMAVLLILEPIFEADFLDCSYGFRPGRSAHQALDAIREHLRAGRREVYDADLKAYFDTIPHDQLLKCLADADRGPLGAASDPHVAGSAVVETDERGRTTADAPEAGNAARRSDLALAGEHVPALVREAVPPTRRPGTWAKARLVRYADDFVILARYQGRRLQDWVESTLEGRFRLTINREKTRVVNLNEPQCLAGLPGFHVPVRPRSAGPRPPLPERVPVEEVAGPRADELRELLHRGRVTPIPTLIAEVNRLLGGWSRYFSHGYPRRAFRKVNRSVVVSLTSHLHRRSQRPYRPPADRSFYAQLQRLGLRLL